MIPFRTAISALVILSAFAANATAQSHLGDWWVEADNPTMQFPLLPGSPPFDATSADFVNALASGSGWGGTFTSLASGDLRGTVGMRKFGWTLDMARERYQAMAYLATQLRPENRAQWTVIRGAIWYLMAEGSVNPQFARLGLSGQISAMAERAMLGVAANPDALDLSEWAVVSNAAGTQEMLVQGVPQDFMAETVVPEPEVLILLATGLLTLGAIAYLRGFSA
jgi:hypothetical protein